MPDRYDSLTAASAGGGGGAEASFLAGELGVLTAAPTSAGWVRELRSHTEDLSTRQHSAACRSTDQRASVYEAACEVTDKKIWRTANHAAIYLKCKKFKICQKEWTCSSL